MAEKLQRAEERFAEALAWREKHYGAAHWSTIDAQIALADVRLMRALTVRQLRKYIQWEQALQQAARMYDEAEYGASLQSAEQAATLCQDVVGPEHPNFAKCLSTIARALRALGEPSEAVERYRQALDVRAKAFAALRQGSQVLHPDYAENLDDLAATYCAPELKQFLPAKEAYLDAIEIRRQLLGENSLAYAISLSNLAALDMTIQNYVRAEDEYTRAAQIVRDSKSESSAEYGARLHDLGALYEQMGRFADAESNYTQALEVRKKTLGADHPDYALSLAGMASLHQRRGQYAEAALKLQEALEIVFAHVENNSYRLTERQQILYSQSLQFYLDSYLRCAVRVPEIAQLAYRHVLAWKGSTLVRQRAARLVADTPELAALRGELDEATRRWATLAGARPDKGEEQWQIQMEQLTKEKQRLEIAFTERARALRMAQNESADADRATLETVIDALPADAALVDYFEFWDAWPSKFEPGQWERKRKLAAFVVRPGADVTLVNLDEVDSLTETIDLWRESFGMSPEGRAAGLRLRDRLWDPLAAALAGAETVLISPDGALGRLPFAALPGDSEETYLIDKYRLALVPVPQLIPVLTTPPLRNAAQRELLLLGDVDYSLRPESLDEAIADDDGTPDRPLLPSERLLAGVRAATDGSHWDRLPGGAAEVGAIRDLYERLFGLGPDQIADLRGGEATEAQFRLLAPHCFQLHLATHGFFAAPDRESALSASHLAEAEAAAGGSFSSSRRALLGFSPGLLSGLVFAGANDPPELPADGSKLTDIPDDGILTSDE
ncbi:MAG TPA: tetratricopeptide repeat protein, partial [Lacipirellulaceae bacterium]|nr:tetratricopeptide repeat protein [Lacipirellulaceae bacterium]